MPLVDATLARIASLPFWGELASWREAISSVLGCVEQNLQHDRSPLWLLFCCAEATGCPPQRAIPVAAAWSLGYIAAQLFDAVEDQEFEPGDWGGLSPAEAINLAGAFLAAVPLVLDGRTDVAVEADLRVEFQHTALKMASGQHADLSGWVGSGEGAVERYWQVAEAKSGVLFALACWAGARLGDPPAEVLAAFTDFGHSLGLLIQACDDYRDTYEPGGASNLIAPAALPVVYGRMVAGPGERAQIETLLSRLQADPQAAAKLCHLLDDLGARHYLLIQTELLELKAQKALRRTGATGSNRDRLLGFLPRLRQDDQLAKKR